MLCAMPKLILNGVCFSVLNCFSIVEKNGASLEFFQKSTITSAHDFLLVCKWQMLLYMAYIRILWEIGSWRPQMMKSKTGCEGFFFRLASSVFPQLETTIWQKIGETLVGMGPSSNQDAFRFGQPIWQKIAHGSPGGLRIPPRFSPLSWFV